MNILKISLMGIIVVVFAVQLKEQKQEYSLFLILGASLFLFSYGSGQLSSILEVLKKVSLSSESGQSYWSILVKMIGITYISEFASGICKDAGFHSIASQIDIFGKLSILLVSLPVLITLLETVESFLT